jgi:flagellar hook-associated protein 3 FlgL
MRLTFGAMHRNAQAGIEGAATRLTEFQRQVSTGKRIEKPSDDPSATLGSIGEHNETAAIDQYTRTTNTVASRLAVVDTVLSDMITQLTSAQVASASARGSSKTQIQRDAAATELEGIRDTIFSDLTTAFNGTYLFSGSNSTVAPYTRPPGGGPISPYAGSANEMIVDVDQQRAIKITFNGQQITQGADAQDIFVEFDNLIAAVRAGNVAGIDAGMQALDRMFDRVSTTQGRVGADLRTVDEQKVRLDELKRSSAKRISALEDTNMAEAISGMAQADAAYRAALGAASTVTKQSLMDYLR